MLICQLVAPTPHPPAPRLCDDISIGRPSTCVCPSLAVCVNTPCMSTSPVTETGGCAGGAMPRYITLSALSRQSTLTLPPLFRCRSNCGSCTVYKSCVLWTVFLSSSSSSSSSVLFVCSFCKAETVVEGKDGRRFCCSVKLILVQGYVA